MNRELVRILAYLQVPAATELFLEQLRGKSSNEEKLHVALYARFLTNWTTKQRLELLSFYEYARTLEGGHSYQGYIENVSRDFFASLTNEERMFLLSEGTKWPSSALSVLAKLPAPLSPELMEQVIALDRQIVGLDGEAIRKLGVGVIAIMGREIKQPRAQEYLRELYERDPQRRGYIAMSLAQQPNGANWPILVQSISAIEGMFAQEVLSKLATVEQKPDNAEPWRQTIIRGLRLGDNGGQAAIILLEKWSGQKLGTANEPVAARLAKWQAWYAKQFPNAAAATLPQDDAGAKWTLDELLTYLNGKEAAIADHARGAVIFQKAQCAKCHRFGDQGEGLGPDLSTVSRRFQKREILESIIHPSQVISDQYASKQVVLKNGRSLTGIVAEQADGQVLVLTSDAQKIALNKSDIDEIQASSQSAMPTGLLNSLTLEEIGDLFAYLNQPPSRNISSRKTR